MLKEMAKRLKSLREIRGISQQETAEAAGMAQTTYSGWEKRAPVAFESLAELCRFHGVSSDYVLGLTNSPQGHYTEKSSDEIVKLVEMFRRASTAKRREIQAVVATLVEWDAANMIEAMSAEERSNLLDRYATPKPKSITPKPIAEAYAVPDSVPEPQDQRLMEEGPRYGEATGQATNERVAAEAISGMPDSLRTEVIAGLIRGQGPAVIKDAMEAFSDMTRDDADSR